MPFDQAQRVKVRIIRQGLRYGVGYGPQCCAVWDLSRPDHEEVGRWYKVADVCLVTSLHDGMNLVAKEYVAARDDEDGMLVLSKFTGAAVELRDALIVNPYDIGGVAEAIHLGLEMKRTERRQRMRRMRRQVMEHNIYRWAARILGDLRELRLEGAGAAQLRQIEPVFEQEPEISHEKLA